MSDASVMATPAFERVRQHLVLALDVATLEEAVALTAKLHPYFATVKVGLELYLAAGRDTVRALAAFDVDVFLDLKLHDIPTTVERAAHVVGGLGARYVTVHTAGGPAMVRACVEGLAGGAERAGRLPALAVGVTVLTSDTEASSAVLGERAQLAKAAGCGGLVCAAPDLPVTRSAAPGLLTIVPGTRPLGAPSDDQARVTTPREALDLGADLLVVGRPVTRAVDPSVAAFELATSLLDR